MFPILLYYKEIYIIFNSNSDNRSSIKIQIIKNHVKFYLHN